MKSEFRESPMYKRKSSSGPLGGGKKNHRVSKSKFKEEKPVTLEKLQNEPKNVKANRVVQKRHTNT